MIAFRTFGVCLFFIMFFGAKNYIQVKSNLKTDKYKCSKRDLL